MFSGACILDWMYIYFLAEMQQACKSLNGRYFGGKIVSATRYDQDMYEANDLSG